MNESSRRILTSRSDFASAVDSALQAAADAGAAEIILCDADFGEWPLGAPETLEALSRWIGARRQLSLYAKTFDVVASRHGRWVQWRRHWSHAVHCRSNDELESSQYPTICWVPDVISVRLFDRTECRGLASADAADGVACREAIDAVSQRSAEAFPVTTLGL